ncbi:MAG: epoxyqueuosine reductase QueH [Thermoplasmata archaeon]|nr:epoxyqueuosine reductase QueH [Thermoplasmata archaeon]
MKILLHACCAPCLMAPYKNLSESHDITVFWYNPNIQPYREYLRRLRTFREYTQKIGVKVIEDLSYPLEDWLYKASILSRKSNVLRCRFCYADRLFKTAKKAKDLGMDAFTTTLLLAPYQKHEMVKEIGGSIASRVGIKFYYEDMRKWFDESEKMARNAGIYRQGYCGCVFSEADRYWRDKI